MHGRPILKQYLPSPPPPPSPGTDLPERQFILGATIRLIGSFTYNIQARKASNHEIGAFNNNNTKHKNTFELDSLLELDF
ncbi:hypothetical protein BLOT_012276 [Blomia tropicalis]|nr:hypothetical protein BLOT_012276 [Blomia tropicalis]